MTAPWRWLDFSGLRFAALLLAMLCLMPPDGALSDNEEFYFQIAAQKVGAAPVLPQSAVFDSSRQAAKRCGTSERWTTPPAPKSAVP